FGVVEWDLVRIFLVFDAFVVVLRLSSSCWPLPPTLAFSSCDSLPSSLGVFLGSFFVTVVHQFTEFDLFLPKDRHDSR
ncbi:uncharacterized protein F5147DRAFT_762966, partial [Suillus discolor]